MQRDDDAPTGEKPTSVRMPYRLRAALQRFAGEDRRSLNREIVWILDAYAQQREAQEREEQGK